METSSQSNSAVLESPQKVDRILAVDDSPDNLFLIQGILMEGDYEVILAEDGASALEQVAADPPDLILLDIMMPGIDGYEVTRQIRQNDRLPYIPILMITAHGQSSLIEGLDSGADDFIRKPIVEVDELLARVRALLRLKHTIDERDQMIRQREDFVSRLTHDLRTPLVAADRMLTLIRAGGLGKISADIETAMATMIRSNQNLLHMVNTLLEVYRHEAGQSSLTFSPFNLPQMMQEVVQELQPLAQEKELTIALDIPNPDWDFGCGAGKMRGDRLELRRVMMNLIGNAIKFTDTGAVKVALSQMPQADSSQSADSSSSSQPVNRQQSSQPHVLVITVEDTGSGIPPADQSTIFERFRQGSHKRAGSGLGLHLARRIVESHQGTIALQSEVGQGSLFTVQIPVCPE